ncbi:glycerophosphodiester phosphodiesterase [Paenibacillus mendelii]|uniref:Glycerophosphodiester phosphodiesterase n=1 Tax=Paenibacillus mendelii TaxID=206163 RepID=A0ABV6J8K9_9BACL|nr:glycerophosphodiester phosphodiesterase [Paenibacillus mendelii]MCQ6559456.1 glycerophosphodiester phosphodiesterase [Paenibacillus mendelii]
MKLPMVAAHTGCGTAPDNTWASFLEGIQMNADIVEIDIRVTSDGTAILLHDDSPYLREYTYEQLNQAEYRTKLDAIYEEHEIVRLEDVLRYIEPYDTKLNLDVKDVSAIDPTIALVQRYHAQERIFITGCSDGITQRYPDIQVMLNTPDDLSQEDREDYASFASRVCREAANGSYSGLNMAYGTCQERVTEMASELNLAVWVYTVNRREDMKRLINLGVDAITTRNPILLQDIINNYSS